ncbi:hypothetical protein FA95DRAFT_556122 [Auriscalpium vulgare]|uniref:Uncharacterized protein n=1 Tax=Auriscalpium vulgare TaxID=40419 RepID=A0ACB8RF25_9AGAM|nr:hypothetical protein FA95DRAFT_556122 [Auriscalpium vulgare]
MDLSLQRSDPEVAVVSSCILAAANGYYLQCLNETSPPKYSLALLQLPPHLLEHIKTEEDFHCNAHVINIIDLLTKCLPCLRKIQCGHVEMKSLYWVLDVLRSAPRPPQTRPSEAVCKAFLVVWDEMVSLVAGHHQATIIRTPPPIVQDMMSLLGKRLWPFYEISRVEDVPEAPTPGTTPLSTSQMGVATPPDNNPTARIADATPSTDLCLWCDIPLPSEAALAKLHLDSAQDTTRRGYRTATGSTPYTRARVPPRPPLGSGQSTSRRRA